MMNIKKETVKIAETYQDMIMEGTGEWKSDRDTLKAIQKANRYKCMAMTWLTESEIDELEPKEYNDILKKCWVLINPGENFTINKGLDSQDYEKKN